ncbi:nifU-like protein 4, mitochondrial [Prunus avium]|uniref:NifU-like protein 4, mitochondrial n=1 Tax=Prunus avium TaxID=42229 RepID=A0A6P5T9V2_PRUAV|nr:nifU-like protein 4, mitochondrial [Prunus avium]
MAISFGSMSIKTRPSTNSNESYDGYGYVMSNYSGTSYKAQDDETDYGPTSWVNPNYSIYGRTVGRSRETYVHYVQTWLTNSSGYITCYDYCMNLDGITQVFYGSDFVTVTKSDDASWDLLKPEIFAAIMDFYSSGQPLFLDTKTASAMDTAIQEDDSEIVAMIKELLETRIRPAVQDDGGDIEYRGFHPETGIVKLRMQGACSGCPSSSVTLKSGIENMRMHYVPEVTSNKHLLAFAFESLLVQ